MEEKSILIGADIAFIGQFKNFDSQVNLGKQIRELIDGVDYRIYDLELPLTNSDDKISKTGPNLKMQPSEILGLKQLQPNLLVTANNHIMDYGTEGVKSTIDILEKEDIDNIGSGIDVIRCTSSFELDGYKFGIYNGAEKEFSEQRGKTYINVFDEGAVNIIRQLKDNNDYVIAIYHGGIEHYVYPGDYLVTRCHAMADAGADLILCQHNHIIGVFEEYNKSTILYGQGNFIADYNYSDTDYGLLVKLNWNNEEINVSFIPIEKNGNIVELVDSEKSAEMLNQLEERSKNDFSAKYHEYIQNEIYHRLQACCAMPLVLRKIDNHTNHFFIKCKFRKKDLLLIQNLVRCDVHRNGIIDGISPLLK